MTMTNDELLAWLDSAASEMDVLGEAAAAIRALEAKVAYWRDEVTRRDDQYAALLDGHMAVVDDRDRLAGEVERLTGLYNQRMIHLNAAQDREVALLNEVERIRVQFDEAIARIEDMLEDDDGQAFKEAGKFLLRIKGHDYE